MNGPYGPDGTTATIDIQHLMKTYIKITGDIVVTAVLYSAKITARLYSIIVHSIITVP